MLSRGHRLPQHQAGQRRAASCTSRDSISDTSLRLRFRRPSEPTLPLHVGNMAAEAEDHAAAPALQVIVLVSTSPYTRAGPSPSCSRFCHLHHVCRAWTRAMCLTSRNILNPLRAAPLSCDNCFVVEASGIPCSLIGRMITCTVN